MLNINVNSNRFGTSVDGGIQLTWKAIAGVTGYGICRLKPDGSKWTEIVKPEKLTAATYLDTGARPGIEEVYVVRLYRYNVFQVHRSQGDATSGQLARLGVRHERRRNRRVVSHADRVRPSKTGLNGPCGRGGVGRHGGLRIRCRKAWRFESSRPQIIEQPLKIKHFQGLFIF